MFLFKLINILIYIQFNAPFFHSWNNPVIKIKLNKILVINHINILEIFKVIIIGINNAISISKIKKIIVIIKNRNENGIRLKKIGLNPHSKGDIFSKFILNFIEIIIEILIINNEINKFNLKIIKNK